MKLEFTKMQALGNDFVVLDFTKEVYPLKTKQAAFIADRHFGIGCDQILIVESSQRDGIDFLYRILNADGSEVGQCGNGARCFARYVHDQKLTNKTEIRVETISGDMTLKLLQDDNVQVNMGVPQFTPSEIPFSTEQQQSQYALYAAQQTVSISAVSMGNPHAVLLVDDIQLAPVATLGPAIESHEQFPARVNVGFMQINQRNDIHLRVFERGAGETLACGSGACAAVVSGIELGLLDNEVTTHLIGGDLNIKWAGKEHPVIMTGPAKSVYTGAIQL